MPRHKTYSLKLVEGKQLRANRDIPIAAHADNDDGGDGGLGDDEEAGFD